MSDNQVKIRQAFEEPKWYLTNTAYNIAVRMETARKFVKDLGRFGAILDIGCGDGSLSLQFLDPQTKITLLDRSTTMLKVAAARVPEHLTSNVRIVNDNFLTTKLEREEFDLVICVGVLAYVEELKAFAEKLVMSLKPNGSLIVECSDGSHFVRRATRAYDAFRRKLGASDFNTVCRSSSEVVSAFNELGFRPQHVFRYSQPVPVVRKMLSQRASYYAVRLIHGTALANRAPWLGSECIYHFVRAGTEPLTSR